MNKLIGLAALLGCSMAAQADTVLGLYAGVEGWRMGTSGGYANSPELNDFDFDDETQAAFYLALEHPIPLLPNIKVRRGDLDTQGNIVLSQNFSFGNQLFVVDQPVDASVDVTNTDIILYYELFDNDLISFDFGLNGKYLDGDLLVQDSNDPSRTAFEDFSGVVPMLYSRFAVGFPLTGWGAFAEGSYLAIDDHTLYDYQIALTYSFVESLAVDLSLQLGYRALSLELEDLDGIYSDLEFDGPYAGLEVHF